MICETSETGAAAPFGPKLLVAVAEAEDALARLDERLRANPIRDGFCARAHFSDACARLWLAGELVHMEDLVLHDSEMDLRAPTHELTRAHAVLRARRRIANSPPGAFFRRGLDALRGQDRSDSQEEAGQTDAIEPEFDPLPSHDEDPLAAEFLAIDAVIARSSRLLAAGPDAATAIQRSADSDEPGHALIYDPDHDEQAFFAQWRSRVEASATLPPTRAAAVAYEAWCHTDAIDEIAIYVKSRSYKTTDLPQLTFTVRYGLDY